MKRNNLADHFCCRFSSVSVVRWLPLARSCVNHSKVGSGLVTMVCVFFFLLRLCSLLLSASLQLSFLSPLTFPPSLSALEKYAWERSKCATAQSIKCLHDIILHQASSVGSKTKKRTENNCFALSLLSSPIPVLPFSQLAHIFPAGWRCFSFCSPLPHR